MGLSRLEEDRVGEALLVAQGETTTGDCAERVVSMKRSSRGEQTVCREGDSKYAIGRLLCDSQSPGDEAVLWQQIVTPILTIAQKYRNSKSCKHSSCS